REKRRSKSVNDVIGHIRKIRRAISDSVSDLRRPKFSAPVWGPPPNDFDFSKFVQSISGQKSPFPIPKTPSAFHPNVRRNAFHRRDARQQSRSFARENQWLTPSPNSNRPF